MIVLNAALGVLLALVFFAGIIVIVREQNAWVQSTRKPRWWLALLTFVVLAIDLPLFFFVSRGGITPLIFGVLIVLLGVLFLVLGLRVRTARYSKRTNILLAAVVMVVGLAVVAYGIPAATADPCRSDHCYSGLSGTTHH